MKDLKFKLLKMESKESVCSNETINLEYEITDDESIHSSSPQTKTESDDQNSEKETPQAEHVDNYVNLLDGDDDDDDGDGDADDVR